MFIDSHAHLDMPQFEPDIEDVIKRAIKEEVDLIVNVGPTLEGSIKSIELANRYDFIYAAVGIHPHDAKDLDDDSYKKIEELIQDRKVIAVGEIGLDFYKNYSHRKEQISVFKRQIQLAKRYKKPIIVHSRDAKDDTLHILKDEDACETGGILHCFSGDQEMLKTALEMGFYISFAGQVTFPKATELQNLVKKVPADRILIETDCPYLAPQPKRGERNEPSYVKYTAEKIASLRNINIDDLERIISVNFYNLFGIGNSSNKGKISYRIRNSLYLNITNKCTNSCNFCARFVSYYVQGHNLRLDHEPTVEEALQSIDSIEKYDEIVFCGFGEPTMRLDLIKEVAQNVKEKGIRVRLNTNGHGNIINKRNILPELAGIVDSISISLNAEDGDTYNNICQPLIKNDIYKNVCEFIIEAKRYIPEVVATVLDMPDVINIKKCERIAKEDMGVGFRVRRYNMVGA